MKLITLAHLTGAPRSLRTPQEVIPHEQVAGDEKSEETRSLCISAEGEEPRKREG